MYHHSQSTYTLAETKADTTVHGFQQTTKQLTHKIQKKIEWICSIRKPIQGTTIRLPHEH